MSSIFEIKKAHGGKFFFQLKTDDGKVILTSELYKQKASSQNGIVSVQKNSHDESKYSRLRRKNGKFYFTLKAANYQVIGTSELYDAETERENGIKSIIEHGSATMIKDLTKRNSKG